MEWNQTIPLHSGSHNIIFQICENVLPLTKIETAVHLVHLHYAWTRFSEVSASDKPAESSCGPASSQQFFRPPVSTNSIRALPSNLVSNSSLPHPQQQPILIESNMYYLSKETSMKKSSCVVWKSPNFTE